MHAKKQEKIEKQGRYRLPPNGGRGVWEPLSHLLFINYYNALMFLSSLESTIWDGGMKEEGSAFQGVCLFCSLLASSLWAFLIRVEASCIPENESFEH